MSTTVSDDTIDNNTAINTQEWAGWKHADIVCIIYPGSNSMKKYLVYNTVVSQENTTWDSNISIQAADSKTSSSSRIKRSNILLQLKVV